MSGAVSGPPDRPQPADEELMHRVAAGDSDALAQLFKRYSGTVYSLEYRMLNDREGAEELAHLFGDPHADHQVLVLAPAIQLPERGQEPAVQTLQRLEAFRDLRRLRHPLSIGTSASGR